MSRRKLSKAARFERLFRVLEYLRKNTDREHPATQAEMRKDAEVAEFIGHKETFNRLIKDMARAMNNDEHGYKAEKDWKIVFDDFRKYYGDDPAGYETEDEAFDDEEAYDDFLDQTMHINGLYYNHEFSYEEVDALIDGVWGLKALSTEDANRLVEKIKENLTTKYYQGSVEDICKIREPDLADRAILHENLQVIRKAIKNDVRVRFRFNGYTHRKTLEPKREEKYTVSPYYIVASGGRYYLLACMDGFQNMSIWRIDLMTDMEAPGADGALQKGSIRRIPKRNVENLPLKWSEDFQLKHLNMSFDKPEWITLRIKSEKIADAPARSVRPDYTFLHDWFGDHFKFVKTEKEPPYDDIVMVECSPYGMVNWALQYSDRVEVMAPEHVREAVVEKVKRLTEKYGGAAKAKSLNKREINHGK